MVSTWPFVVSNPVESAFCLRSSQRPLAVAITFLPFSMLAFSFSITILYVPGFTIESPNFTGASIVSVALFGLAALSVFAIIGKANASAATANPSRNATFFMVFRLSFLAARRSRLPATADKLLPPADKCPRKNEEQGLHDEIVPERFGR